jgi:hypothetical protein
MTVDMGGTPVLPANVWTWFYVLHDAPHRQIFCLPAMRARESSDFSGYMLNTPIY